jgi:hypothetical protein
MSRGLSCGIAPDTDLRLLAMYSRPAFIKVCEIRPNHLDDFLRSIERICWCDGLSAIAREFTLL